MSVWEALVFSISLITSNLLILNGIAKFDLKGKTPFTFLLMAFATSTGYGLLRYVTIILYDDFYLVTNILFFLNNLWLLVFFRNAVVQYNDRIPIGRYFVLSIVCFLLPISIGLFFNPINNFETLMVQMSYMLGIIPMVVYSSMLAGVSVGSAFWGIIIACFLFSVDFFLRFGFFHILQTEFQEVISETFRVVSILLISIFGHYGQPIPPGKIREVIPGTQRLNNIFFALIAFFPVMIFYTVFWQVNLNDRKMQQKEIELSKEVFMISSRMLEEKIDTYSRIVNEVKNSANLATAQWKLKTFLFTDPEIDVKSGDILGPYTFENFKWATVKACKVDSDKKPLAGWELTLGTVTQKTGDDGCTTFTVKNPGDYKLAEVLQDGWTLISPATNNYDVTVKTGDILGPYTFENFKWATVKACKVDSDKKPLAGWELTLGTVSL